MGRRLGKHGAAINIRIWKQDLFAGSRAE
jgi:hypothetical protein